MAAQMTSFAGPQAEPIATDRIARLNAPGSSGSPMCVFARDSNGNAVYESDVYRVEFDSDGHMTSLKVMGHEFLRQKSAGGSGDGSGGAAFFQDGACVVQDAISVQCDGGLIADGVHGSFIGLHLDRIDLDLGNDKTDGLAEFVIFPADGVSVSPAPNPVIRGSRPEHWQRMGQNAVRLTNSAGVAIELQYDLTVRPSDNAAVIEVPHKTRICGEIRLPPSNWAREQATVSIVAAKIDHNFAKGQPIQFGGEILLDSPDSVTRELELLVQIEDMSNETVVWEQRHFIDVVQGIPKSYSAVVDWDKPGPWRVRVLVIAGDHCIGSAIGVVVYDLDHYLPPLERQPDFWEFWDGAVAAQRQLPLDTLSTRDEAASTANYTAYNVSITGHMGRRLSGKWIEPCEPGPHPVIIGLEHPGAAFIPPSQAGVCELRISMEGSATYRTGLGSRWTSNFFYNYIDPLRWVDYIASCGKADLDRSIYYAGSRSGPVGIALLALDSRVRMYIANVPTNNRWDWQVTQPGAGAWGPWAADRPAGMSMAEYVAELSYFNPDNFAERVTQPVLIGFGLLDVLSQVTGNLACYARLASSRKKICFQPWAGHADASAEWAQTARVWRDELFGRRPVEMTNFHGDEIDE